jgi:hypothetical protein
MKMKTVSIDNMKCPFPFRMTTCVGLRKEQGIESTFLKGNIGIHNNDILYGRRGGRGGRGRREPF